MRIKLHTPLGFSEIGGRVKQEDAMFPQLDNLSSENRVFLVCDGLGGHEHGEVASAIVATNVGRWIEENVSDDSQLTREMVRQAVAQAQEHLNQADERFKSDKPMGTTMAMLAFSRNGAVTAHIGDSRIYHIRPASRKILFRSRDHSLVNDLFVAGRLTRAEAEASPKKNILTRAMLAAPAPAAKADVVYITNIEPGDYFLLCSDGVCGEISDNKLLKVLCDSSKNNAQKMAALQLLAQSGADNRTALLLEVDRVELEDGDELLENTERACCDKMVFLQAAPVAAAVGAKAASGAVAPAVPKPEVPASPAIETEPPAVEAEPQDIPPVPPTVEEAPQPVDAVAEIPPVEPEEIPPVVPEEVPPAVPAAKGDGLKRALWLLLAALLLAAGVTAFFMLKKPAGKTETKPRADTLVDPDVTIDTVLPEAPVDSFALGTDVDVPPVPRVTSVPTPDYPTGSNVGVPLASHTAPPSAFNDNDSYDDDYSDPAPPEPEKAPEAPEPAQTRQVPPAVPNKSSSAIGASNRGTAVPPPPGKQRNVTAPY